MNNHDKIILGVLLAAIVGLYFYTRNTSIQLPVASSLSPSTNVPWYLTYNNSPDYIHSSNGNSPLPIPLPNNSAGQNNAQSCDVCSLFPNYNVVQL